MLIHPAGLFILLMDVGGILLALPIIQCAVHTTTHWAPSVSHESALKAEASSERLSWLGRCVSIMGSAAGIAWLMAITLFWVPGVPGAMCGTGVMQASAGFGAKSLVARTMLLGMLYVWRALENINNAHPRWPLADSIARWSLLFPPFQVMTAYYDLKLLQMLDKRTTVDCCASVYSPIRSELVSTVKHTPHPWDNLGLLLLLSLLVFAIALWIIRRQNAGKTSAKWLLVTVIAWTITAERTLLETFSAYFYQVLNHHCPWCFFLPEHDMVGWIFLGLPLLVAFEGAAQFTCTMIGGRTTLLHSAVKNRIRVGAWRISTGVATWLLAAGIPVIGYRIRFGVWL